MTDEVCLCGIPKADHLNVDYLKVITADTEPYIKEKLSTMLHIYGNICTNYRRDNLKFLEEVSNNG
jgi:hypothetical protein